MSVYQLNVHVCELCGTYGVQHAKESVFSDPVINEIDDEWQIIEISGREYSACGDCVRRWEEVVDELGESIPQVKIELSVCPECTTLMLYQEGATCLNCNEPMKRAIFSLHFDPTRGRR